MIDLQMAKIFNFLTIEEKKLATNTIGTFTEETELSNKIR